MECGQRFRERAEVAGICFPEMPSDNRGEDLPQPIAVLPERRAADASNGPSHRHVTLAQKGKRCVVEGDSCRIAIAGIPIAHDDVPARCFKEKVAITRSPKRLA